MGSGAKSYMRKGFLRDEEMRKYLTIYEEAVTPLVICDFAPGPFCISLHMRKFYFLLYQLQNENMNNGCTFSTPTIVPINNSVLVI
jgi:hypothetical protein